MRVSFLLILLLTGASVAAAPVPDVRVAIDVSGSMKQTDPRNLRRPALRLLTGLLPEGSRAGVWTFGQYVNMAVPWGRVTPAWKAKARAEAGRIHSRGRYTNIEEVIQKAAFNWRRPDPRYARHLILLTDGKVDIARDAEVDALSRRRILETLLPQLVRAGVQVHTVALSVDSDRALLETLAAETGGRFAEAASAADLQRIFLQLFERAAPRPALPIEGNRFTVDAGVREMTLVVFRRPADPPLRIQPPQGRAFDEAGAPDPVSWYHEDGYDLVTVRAPARGEWRLLTRVDPENRVLVLTDLRLEVRELPTALLAGDPLPVQAWLRERERRITRRDFLELVRFTALDRQGEAQPPQEWLLSDEGRDGDDKARDGVFGRRVDGVAGEGEHVLLVRADGATFQREFRHVYRVLPALLRLQVEKAGEGFHLGVTPERLLIDPAEVKVIREDTGEPLPSAGEQGWELALPAAFAGKTLAVRIEGRRRTGQPVQARYTVQLPGAPSPVAEHAAAAGHATPPEAQAAPEAHGEAPGAHEEAPAEHGQPAEAETGPDWTRILILTLLINLLLAAVGIAGWLVLRRLRQRKLAQDEEALQI